MSEQTKFADGLGQIEADVQTVVRKQLVHGPRNKIRHGKLWSMFVFVLTEWQRGHHSCCTKRICRLEQKFDGNFHLATQHVCFNLTFVGNCVPVSLAQDARALTGSIFVGPCHQIILPTKLYGQNAAVST